MARLDLPAPTATRVADYEGIRIEQVAYHIETGLLPAEAARLVKVTGENAGEWFETVGAALTKFLKTLV